jgi:hypothetical protein
MDREDLRDVISAHQKCVAGTVGRFGGAPSRRKIKEAPAEAADDEAFRVLALGALKCPPVVIPPIGHNTRE